MLYILGGSSRSGKSIVGRRFVKEKAIPFFCIDFLITSLQEIPSLDIEHGQPFIEKAEKLWPFVKPLLGHLVAEEPNYFIEGDGILPKHVIELLYEYPGEVKACFVGFAEIGVDQKMREIRGFGGQKDDWTAKLDDEELKDTIQQMVKFSKYLKNACSENSLPYFDTSVDFEHTIDKVFQYFTGEE